MLLVLVFVSTMCCVLVTLTVCVDKDLAKEPKYIPKVSLLKPNGFKVTIEGAKDIRQMHIFWNHRKPYNHSNPYSTTDFTNVTFNENHNSMIEVGDYDLHLRIGDSIFYWLLLITRDWQRISLHKLNFWVKFDGVPEHFAETYYRDYDISRSDEL